MTDSSAPDTARQLARLKDAERRFNELGRGGAAGGETAPDEKTGERWQETQVWGHLTEFPGYWVREIRRIIEEQGGSAPAFGRTPADADRLAAIEAGRTGSREELVLRATNAIADAKAFLTKLDSSAWALRGQHVIRGEMTVADIVDRFIVNHLEEHAEQLESLRAGSGSS